MPKIFKTWSRFTGFRNKKTGFALIPLAIAIVISFSVGAIVVKTLTDNKPNPFNKAFQKAKKSLSQGDLIDGYPHECQKRMGFDNWRTFRSFAIDPQDSKILYVAIEYKGVYKSQDGGKTWTSKNKGLKGYPSKNDPQIPCQEQHPLLTVDPSNSKRLLLTSASSPGTLKDMNSENGGVYESIDAGESWHQLFNENMNAWTYEALALNPKDTSTVYVGTTAMAASYDEADPNKTFVKKGIVYKTQNAGKNWEELATGIVPDLRSGRLFVNPDDPAHIIFTTIALPSNKGGGVVRDEQLGIIETKDAGQTWKQVESLPKNQRAIAEAEIASQNFQNMFISVRSSNGGESKYYTLDGGKTFNNTTTSLNLFRYDPHDLKGLRLLGYNLFSGRSLYESLDGGKTWQTYSDLPKEVNNELRISNIVWDPNNKDVVYLNGEKGKIWKSENNGKTWQLILSLDTIN